MAKAIDYGLIGAGVRAEALLARLSEHRDRAELKAVFDTSPDRSKLIMGKFGTANTCNCSSVDELMKTPGLSWVLVMTPNALHKQHIVAAFEAGHNVFAEKPLATTIDDCVAIDEAHRRAGTHFATGFVLRYSPLYRKAHEIIASGRIGKVVTVEANENIPPAHGGHIMTNWRRFAEISGSHILEKCCHDLDLLNWLIDSLPSRVASFGGLDIFTAERADAIDQFEPPPGKASVFTSWETPTRDADDPFRTDKTIIDNQVAIIEYRNGARATFHTSLSNAIPERRMHFGGTDGTLVLEFYSGRLELKRLGHGQPTERYDLGGTGGHGGGDAIIMRELAETMAGEHPPACSGAEGLRSAVAALAIEQARREGRIVNLGETWHRLGQ